VKLILHENLFSRCRKKRTKKRQFFIKYSSFLINFVSFWKQNVTINFGAEIFSQRGGSRGGEEVANQFHHRLKRRKKDAGKPCQIPAKRTGFLITGELKNEIN